MALRFKEGVSVVGVQAEILIHGLIFILWSQTQASLVYSKNKTTAVPTCMRTPVHPEHLTQTPRAVTQSWFCFCFGALGVWLSGLVLATSRPLSHNSYQLGNGEGSLMFPLSTWSHTFSLHHMQHQGELWHTWRKVQSIHFPAHELRHLGLASVAVTDRKEITPPPQSLRARINFPLLMLFHFKYSFLSFLNGKSLWYNTI